MQLNDIEKRWLEINFYIICHKIYTNTKDYQQIENFFRGFSWTNLYDCDRIIKTFYETNIIVNPYYKPQKREILICAIAGDDKKSRFKYGPNSIQELLKPLRLHYYRNNVYVERMKQETDRYKLTVLPKIKTVGFHEAYYSFLLALRYFGELYYKYIKLL